MNAHTAAAIKQVSKRAAERINNLYATSYMDVHRAAGPWGVKHDEDVASVIEEEVLKVFMIAMLSRKKVARGIRSENNKLCDGRDEKP